MDTGTYRLAYLPFDLSHLQRTIYQPLVESGLRFLQQQDVHRVGLTVPGREMLDNALTVDLDQAAVVQAAVEGAVEDVDLVVRSMPQLDFLFEVPMHQVEDRDGAHVFEAAFQPPNLGFYQLSLRLRRADGKVVFNAVGLQVLAASTERPVLAFLDDHYTSAQKAELKTSLGVIFGTAGLEIAYANLAGADALSYLALLSQYLDEGELVLWLGGRMEAEVQGAFSRFLERGGRLLIVSHEFGRSMKSAAFREGVLHTRKELPAPTRKIRSLHLDSNIELDAAHLRLDPLPPAEPILLNDQDQVVGLQVDTGIFRLVYLPFYLDGLEETAYRPLIEYSLFFLQQQIVRRAELVVPGYEELGRSLVLGSEDIVPVRARVEGAVGAAELIVRSMPQQESVLELPMRQVAYQEGEYIFETTFQPPPGQYQLVLRLRRADGKVVFNSVGLQGWTLSTEPPALVFLDGHYTRAEKESLRVSIGEILGTVGLEAIFLDVAKTDVPFYEALLSQYLDKEELVLWLGGRMEAEVEGAFSRFLERGGRLLIVSYGLGRSTKSAAFREGVLHTRKELPASTRKIRSLRLDINIELDTAHLRLDPLPPAEPILLNDQDQVVGLQVDTDTFRLVYLPFYLDGLEEMVYRPLIESSLLFLLERSGQGARLEVETVVGPVNIMPLRPFAPQIVVANTGEQRSDFFRAGYQILQADQVVASFETDAAPLEGRVQRALLLPLWEPSHEGAFRIRFGLSSSREEELVYLPAQALHLVAVPEAFEEVAMEGEMAKGNGAAFFDYDGDGDLDLYLVNEEANSLLRNEGAGTFVDMTSATGVSLADEGSGRSAGFFDCDGDGDLDLYLVNALGANRLYRSDEGLFSEQAAPAGLDDAGNGRGLGLGDYDGDGDVDLFVANTTGQSQSRLYRNAAGAFEDVTEALGLKLVGGEIGAVFGDWDNDGDVDLFVANEKGQNQLFDNEGAISFRQESLYVGARSVGAAFFDYDNDGDLDLATTTLDARAGGDELYQNEGDGLVPVGALLDLPSASQGRGLSFGDVDRDGDVDLFIADVARSRLYRNRADQGHWVQVDLAGPQFNRYGLGTRVEVVAQGRRQVREVQSGYGYGSQVQPRLHFGLGAAGQIGLLRVRWPDGLESMQTNISADQYLTVEHPNLIPSVVEEAEGQPGAFQLQANYPNPFNARTIISYRVPQKTSVKLTIYSIAGQSVKRLVDGVRAIGEYQTIWDGRDDRGRELATGVYLYRLQAGAQIETRKLLLLR